MVLKGRNSSMLISYNNTSFSRTPFASPTRQAFGNNIDDSEEKEIAIALKEALEATVCMVTIFHC